MLQQVKDAGNIKAFELEQPKHDAHYCRNITVTTVYDQLIVLTWYKNLLTVGVPGMQVWADGVSVESTHPSFKGPALQLSWHGHTVSTIGQYN